MSHLMIKLVSLSLPAVMFLAGFAPPVPPLRMPDLMPAGTACKVSVRDLAVTVRNAGLAPAGVTRTRATFFIPGGPAVTVFRPEVPLGPGRATTLHFPPPMPCLFVGCRFTVRVDDPNVVRESNERNNTVSGYCSK